MLLILSSCAVLNRKAVSNNSGGDENKIVSTSVAICGIMDRLDLDLIGVPKTEYTLPKRYSKVKKVGVPITPDMEGIKLLNPDKVLIPRSLQSDLLPKFKAAKISATFVDLSGLDNMIKSIEQLGAKYNREEKAAEIAYEYNKVIGEILLKKAGKTPPKVLILMGFPSSYLVATDSSYMGSLVKTAGGENVFPDGDEFVEINAEAMLKKQPDIILRAAHALPDDVSKMFGEEFTKNDIWKHFSAVKSGKIYDVTGPDFGMSANLEYKKSLDYLLDIFY